MYIRRKNVSCSLLIDAGRTKGHVCTNQKYLFLVSVINSRGPVVLAALHEFFSVL